MLQVESTFRDRARDRRSGRPLRLPLRLLLALLAPLAVLLLEGRADAYPWMIRHDLLRAGRMNLPYGLRVIEHTLWIKSETGTDVNTGQQHGIALSYAPEGWRMEVMGIIGNLQLSPPELRQHGYAAYVERSFAQRAAIGLSSMITHASYDLTAKKPIFRQAHGLFAPR